MMAESKKESPIRKLKVIGPADSSNGAAILRFTREGNKKSIDITAGTYLVVGETKESDITPKEAERLLNYKRWQVKEVKN